MEQYIVGIALFGMLAAAAYTCLLLIQQKVLRLELKASKKSFDNAYSMAFQQTESDSQQKRSELERQTEALRITLRNDAEKKLKAEAAIRLGIFEEAFSAEKVHILAQALLSPEMKTVVNSMKKTIEKHFGKMSQEFVGALADETEGLVRDIQFELSEKLWDSMQQMKEKQDDSPYIMPKNCRMAYTKGTRTVLLIENEPQVRTVEFTEALVSDHEKACAVGSSGGNYRFNLAFPYVYFFVVFENARFHYMEVFFRNKPLLSMREHVYYAPLPNIHRNKGPEYTPMCMGEEFKAQFNDDQSIANQGNYVIAHFWQAAFNSHLGKFGCEKTELDERIRDYARWQEETAKNPLFVLEVKWPSHLTAKGVLESIMNLRGSHPLNGLETHIKKMLDDSVQKIVKRVKEEIKESQKHGIKPEELEAPIRADLESVLVDHADKVFTACRKQS